MTYQEKLDVLNKLEVIHSESGDDLCVLVAKTKHNIDTLQSIGIPKEKLMITDDFIDIVPVAFEQCGASYYTGSKFVIDRVNDAIHDLQDGLNEYWNDVRDKKTHRPDLFAELDASAKNLSQAIEETPLRINEGRQ
ncbi:hypothetical protein PP175_26060 (plasmid) [Aneurinibacillus sp. Ricciae_BoGa-3]|uniref:hypothetical protein n=1 Tax=Aneurinibacillus sp. Ricciae_BoGa-3 TaxID=3022697 RepID=UPI00233FFB91|nr:hypothetical protein [Aneurinibacillus sp. Ricciae_BoGa-3]WCK57532.1 hypothetical protein PP175_26060 [Aneurinibacillus sp. Ricciae_BoGa-3]